MQLNIPFVSYHKLGSERPAKFIVCTGVWNEKSRKNHENYHTLIKDTSKPPPFMFSGLFTPLLHLKFIIIYYNEFLWRK